MRIKNKNESTKIIEELGLNRLPEVLFAKDFNDAELKRVMDELGFEYYGIRNKVQAGVKKRYEDIHKDNVVASCRESGWEKFSIVPSMRNFGDSQYLVGDIMVRKDGSVWYTVSRNPSYVPPHAHKDPDFSGVSDVFDPKLKIIRGMKEIIDYVYKHDLVDIIVEFAIFNQPVGFNKEKIVVWELRTDY